MIPLRLAFLGTPDIAVPTLSAIHEAGHRVELALTQPDRPAGRGKVLQRGAVAARADELGVPVVQPERAGEALEPLAALSPDLLVVLAYGQVLPRAVLDIPRLGAVNAHFSLLPLLRGAAPIQRAILEGHETTGVTTMLMDAGLDTGDILEQAETPIGPQETAGDLAGRLAQIGAALTLSTLELLAQGKAQPRPQDGDKATWASRLRKEEGRVDWSRSARELDLLLRGMDPWPGAQTSLSGKLLKLYSPTRVWEAGPAAAPGVVIQGPEDGRDFLWVGTGRGILGIGRAQLQGKRRMEAPEFMRGSRLEPGARLGD